MPTPTQTQTLQADALNSPSRFQQNHRPRPSDLSPIPLTVVRLRFEGANPNPNITAAQPLPGVANYFIGNDPAKWRTNLSTYAGIVYRELYPGIDLHYDGADGRLKGSYLVSPGADPNLVRWRYQGAIDTQIDAETGDLLISLPDPPGASNEDANRILTERAPIAWQEIDGQHIPITVRYDVAEDGSIGFILGEYDTARLLIIDPTLEYSVILGGGYSDIAAGIAVDEEGSAYIVGTTQSHDFPVTSGTYNGGSTDLFVAKINAGGGLEYATFIGGSNYECPSSGLCNANIAVDDAENAYITSFTHSDDFPITEGAYDDSLFIEPWSGDGKDAIVVRLSGNGTLSYGTYLGGSEWDEGIDIAVDEEGYVYIVGGTLSPDFPTTSGAFDTTHDNTNGYDQDAFIVKLDPSGNGEGDLVYATFLGWSDYECGPTQSCAIALDEGGNIYVAGATSSTDFFTTPGAYDSSHNGSSDAFIIKLNPGGNGQGDLLYATLLGGSELETPYGIDIDSVGNVYVAGRVNSSDFPATPGAFDVTFDNGDGNSLDGFVVKMNLGGNGAVDLLYATYFGGSSLEYTYDLAVDTVGNIYVTGATFSDNFPTTTDAFTVNYAGGSDAFVIELNPSGNGQSDLLYGTFLGGSDAERGHSIDVDRRGNIYIAGFTGSTDFPTTFGSYNANDDTFIVKFAQERAVVEVEILNADGNPVTALGLDEEGWPTPNPLTVQVTLNCPADGPDCDYPFDLTMEDPNAPPLTSPKTRFYLYDKNLDSDGIAVNCGDHPSGFEFSYDYFYTLCTRQGLSMHLSAGETTTMQWFVWVQPSEMADLKITVRWAEPFGTIYTDSKTIPIEQAQIHPIMFIHGLSASLPPSYEQDEALLGVSDLLTGYSKLFETLEKMGYEKDRTLFIYTYDWLYSVINTAANLKHNKLIPTARLIQGEDGNDPVPWVDTTEGVKFDIVTHSTGGMVARAYIQTSIWNSDIRRVVMVAPPLAGVMKGYSGWEGLEPDLDIVDDLLDSVFIPPRAFEAGYGRIDFSDPNRIVLTTEEKYDFGHDPIHGTTIMPEFLPDRQEGERAYLEDNDTGDPYPYDRQANPLLESASVVTTQCDHTHASNGIPEEVCDPYFDDSEHNTTYYGLNEPERMRLFDERIGLENLFIVYGDGYNGDDMPIGFEVGPPSGIAPYWRNGERAGIYGDSGDGTVPVMSALPKGIWFDEEGNSSNIISDTNSFNVETMHGSETEHLKHASLVAFTESQSVTVNALTKQQLPHNFITEFGPSDAELRWQEFNLLTLENLLILIFSPAELTLTDAQGRRLGYDPATGEDLTEIPYGVYLREEDTGHKTIYVPSPEEGEMNLTVTGVGEGDYTILSYFSDETATVNMFIMTGTTTVGQVDTVPFTVPTTSAEIPVPPDVQLGSDLSVDKNQPVTFSGQFSDINPDDTHTLHWNFGDGGAASGTLTPTHTFAAAGIFTVTLTVTDSFGFVGDDSLLVTVSDTSPTAPSADVGDYAVFGFNSIWLRLGSDLHSGHVGAQNISPGPVLNADAEATIGRKVTFHDPASVIAGDTVRLKKKGDVYGIFCNELSTASVVTYTQVITPVSLPLVMNLPALPEINPGSTNYTLAPSEHLTLPAGAYGNIKLKENSVLTLTGGVYHLNNLNMGKQSQLQITAPTEIRLANRLKPGRKAVIGPAQGSGLNGTDLVIFVAGINGNDGSLAATPKAAVIGYNNIVIATIYAPNGTLWLKQGTEARGAFIGQDVKIGYYVQVWRENAFAEGYQSP